MCGQHQMIEIYSVFDRYKLQTLQTNKKREKNADSKQNTTTTVQILTNTR